MAVPLDALVHLLDDRSRLAVEKAASLTPLPTADLAHLLRQGRSGLAACVSTCAPVLPTAGSLFLINRNAAPTYTADGHSWRAKERHMNLKCNGKDAVVCYYSMPKDGAEQPSALQRRRYWLLNQKDLVLLHYLPLDQIPRRRKRAQSPACSLESGVHDLSLAPPPAKRARHACEAAAATSAAPQPWLPDPTLWDADALCCCPPDSPFGWEPLDFAAAPALAAGPDTEAGAAAVEAALLPLPACCSSASCWDVGGGVTAAPPAGLPAFGTSDAEQYVSSFVASVLDDFSE